MDSENNVAAWLEERYRDQRIYILCDEISRYTGWPVGKVYLAALEKTQRSTLDMEEVLGHMRWQVKHRPMASPRGSEVELAEVVKKHGAILEKLARVARPEPERSGWWMLAQRFFCPATVSPPSRQGAPSRSHHLK